jgi:hypothetical protein
MIALLARKGRCRRLEGVEGGEAMYIKTCNLIVSMTIHIHSPSPHSEITSGLCHGEKIEEGIYFAVCVVHTSGQGGYSRLSIC